MGIYSLYVRSEMIGTLLIGDALTQLKTLPDNSVDSVITSPPYYGLRDYGVVGQFGIENTPKEYVEALVGVFREVRRVLKEDGTCWINLGDSYTTWNSNGPQGNNSHRVNRTDPGRIKKSKVTGNFKPKDLIGIPWRVALALQDDGWYLRQDIIWNKPNCMPESVIDRCTRSHEYIFLLTKSRHYYFDVKAIEEPALHKDYKVKRKRSVWNISTAPNRQKHFAAFPPELVETCLKAGCKPGGTILDPFAGSGTTGVVAKRNDRGFILIELNPNYGEIIKEKLEWDKN